MQNTGAQTIPARRRVEVDCFDETLFRSIEHGSFTAGDDATTVVDRGAFDTVETRQKILVGTDRSHKHRWKSDTRDIACFGRLKSSVASVTQVKKSIYTQRIKNGHKCAGYGYGMTTEVGHLLIVEPKCTLAASYAALW